MSKPFDIGEHTELWESLPEDEKKRHEAEAERRHKEIMAEVGPQLKIIDKQVNELLQAISDNWIPAVREWMENNELHPATLVHLVMEYSRQHRLLVNKQKNAEKAKRGHVKGGTYKKQNTIQDIWASGRYPSRDECAEQECAALNMSYSAARKALRNTPEPPSRS